MFQMDALVQLLDGLDFVVGQAKPGQQFELFKSVHEFNVVVGQVEDLQMVQLADLGHPHQFVIAGRQLNGVERKTQNEEKRVRSKVDLISESFSLRLQYPPKNVPNYCI